MPNCTVCNLIYNSANIKKSVEKINAQMKYSQLLVICSRELVVHLSYCSASRLLRTSLRVFWRTCLHQARGVIYSSKGPDSDSADR